MSTQPVFQSFGADTTPREIFFVPLRIKAQMHVDTPQHRSTEPDAVWFDFLTRTVTYVEQDPGRANTGKSRDITKTFVPIEQIYTDVFDPYLKSGNKQRDLWGVVSVTNPKAGTTFRFPGESDTQEILMFRATTPGAENNCNVMRITNSRTHKTEAYADALEHKPAPQTPPPVFSPET